MHGEWLDQVLELAGLTMHYQAVINLFEAQLEGCYQHMDSDGNYCTEEQAASWLKGAWENAADELLEFET